MRLNSRWEVSGGSCDQGRWQWRGQDVVRTGQERTWKSCRKGLGFLGAKWEGDTG